MEEQIKIKEGKKADGKNYAAGYLDLSERLSSKLAGVRNYSLSSSILINGAIDPPDPIQKTNLPFLFFEANLGLKDIL